jgi:nitric oxide reductase subunit B
VTLLPLGIMQLYHCVDAGYFEARSMEFLTDDTNTLFEWLRLPGDVVFITGGVLPLLWLALQGLRGGRAAAAGREGDAAEWMLFTEVRSPDPGEATAAGELSGR